MSDTADIREIAGKSLFEICNMPFWEMTQFIRKHHDKNWGLYSHTLGEPTKTFLVTVHFTKREDASETYEIEACDEKEAKAIAEEQWNDECDYEDEHDYTEATEIVIESN